MKIPQDEASVKRRPGAARKWGEIAKDSVRNLSGSGGLLVKSLHLDHDLDEPLALVHKANIVLNKSLVEGTGHSNSADVAIQTEEDMIVEESPGVSIAPPTESKIQFLGSDPLLFTACDDHVQLVSRKWYKSSKKLVKHLMEVIDHVPEYQERRDLIAVRAIFVWISQNMRYPH